MFRTWPSSLNQEEPDDQDTPDIEIDQPKESPEVPEAAQWLHWLNISQPSESYLFLHVFTI